MKLGIFAALAMALVVSSAFAQIKPATSRPFAADRDQLGMTCAQILGHELFGLGGAIQPEDE